MSLAVCANLNGDLYKNPASKSATITRGHKTEISHPHARVVQRLPLHELRDNKTTYVFRLASEEGQRTSLQRMLLKVDDQTQVVGFQCIAL
jgi:hypothetical protein